MTGSRRASIEVKNVAKQFSGDVTALDELSLSIQPQQFISLLEPSGCGKSTLLRCIAGLESPTRGTITVNDVPVTRPPDGLGMVFQRDALLDWRTMVDN